MRRFFSFCLVLALLHGAAVTAIAQTEHTTPFTGTWKMNVRKSRFNPGPPFRSFSLTFTADGTRKLDLVAADGQPLKVSLPWSDGKEVMVTASGGLEKATAVSRIRGRTFDDTWKENGIIEKVHGVVSSDGSTLTIRVDGTDAQGRVFHNQLLFEKQ